MPSFELPTQILTHPKGVKGLCFILKKLLLSTYKQYLQVDVTKIDVLASVKADSFISVVYTAGHLFVQIVFFPATAAYCYTVILIGV